MKMQSTLEKNVEQEGAWLFHNLLNAVENPLLVSDALNWLREMLKTMAVDAGDPQTTLTQKPAKSYSTGLLDWMPDRSAYTDPELKRQYLLFHAPLGLTEGVWLQSFTHPANAQYSWSMEMLSALLCLRLATHLPDDAASYRDLLEKNGLRLPSVASWEFTGLTGIPSAAFWFPCLQLALGLNSTALDMEVIGFTLAYANSLSSWRLTALAEPEQRGFVFKQLRAHSLKAVECVLSAADIGFRPTMEQRIAAGSRLFEWAESIHIREMKRIAVERPNLDQQVAMIFRAKAPIAKSYHKTAVLQGKLLNDWFAEEPFEAQSFLSAFANSRYADRLSNNQEPQYVFEHLTGFGGPMFGVFDHREMTVIRCWLKALPREGQYQAAVSTRAQEYSGNCSLPPFLSSYTTENTVPHSPFFLRSRTLFHQLLNDRDNAATRVQARRFIKRKLAWRWSTPPCAYTPQAFSALVNNLHENAVQRYKPLTGAPLLTRDDYRWLLTQFAPAVLADGCWLQMIAFENTQEDALYRLLFDIYTDELGSGRMEWNHVVIYRRLLRKEGIELADTASIEFAEDRRLMDASFDLPAYLLALSLFPRSCLPELLGVNLAIELSGLGGGYMRLSEEMQYWGMDAGIVGLHLSIDNLQQGHSAKAAEAVRIYLDRIARLEGTEQQQLHWRRIWRGYRSLGQLARPLVWRVLLQLLGFKLARFGQRCLNLTHCLPFKKGG